MKSEDRFWAKVKKADCWEWTGAKTKAGYGKFSLDGKWLLAHRFSFKISVKPLTKLFICHKCDNPSCVNPDHLFQATPKENTQDALKKGRLKNQFCLRTHCAKGHEFTLNNIYQSGKSRSCKKCADQRTKNNRAKRKCT